MKWFSRRPKPGDTIRATDISEIQDAVESIGSRVRAPGASTRTIEGSEIISPPVRQQDVTAHPYTQMWGRILGHSASAPFTYSFEEVKRGPAGWAHGQDDETGSCKNAAEQGDFSQYIEPVANNTVAPLWKVACSDGSYSYWFCLNTDEDGEPESDFKTLIGPTQEQWSITQDKGRGCVFDVMNGEVFEATSGHWHGYFRMVYVDRVGRVVGVTPTILGADPIQFETCE